MNKFYIKIMFAVLYSVMIACGYHSSSGGSNDMKSSSTATTTTVTSDQNNETRDTTESPTEPTCLLDCSIPDDLQFSFLEKRIDLKENCKVSRIWLLDLGEYLMGFHQSDCGLGNQLYATKISYELTAESSLLLTSDCLKAQGDNYNFEVVNGEGMALVLSTCKINNSFYLSGTTIEFKSNSIVSRTISQTYAPWGATEPKMDALGKWNPEAQAFGVTYSNKEKVYFRRFDNQLSQLGGTIDLSYSSVSYTWPLGLAVRDGQWFTVLNENNGSRYCSRISTNGVLGCSNIRLSSSINTTTYFDGVTYVATYAYDPMYAIGSLNPLNCTLDFSESSIGYLSYGSEDFGGITMGSKYIGAISRNINKGGMVNLSIFSRKPFRELSRIAIMDEYSNSIGKPLIANKYILLPFVRDGLIFVRQSDKKAPQ